VVNVKIFLQETLTNGSQSIIFKDFALQAASVIVNRVSGNGTLTNSTGVNPTGNIIENGLPQPDGFGGIDPDNDPPSALPPKVAKRELPNAQPNTATSAGLVVTADTGSDGQLHTQLGMQPKDGAVVSTTGLGPVYKYLIGNVNIKVGTTQSVFSLENYSDTLGGFTITQLPNKTDLDITGTPTNNPGGYTYTGTRDAPLYTFTVGAAVPEPSSMALCGLIASGMSYAGYRRRKASASEPATVA
jgi:hypothetical protein